MRLTALAGLLALPTLVGGNALAITAELAKKCEAASIAAYPNQRIGSNVGVADRAKFRANCISKNGDVAATSGSPPK